MRPLFIAVLLAGTACSRPPEEKPVSNEWIAVYKGERKVLDYKEEPGPIMSMAALPKDAKPLLHPFLTVSSSAAEEEDGVYRILKTAKSPAEFKSLLEKAGYKVEKK